MTAPLPASGQPASTGADSQVSVDPDTDSGSRDPQYEKDLWHAYELAQQHYETDLQLFSVRMSLFLVIQSALVALVGSAIRIGNLGAADRHAVAFFGIALAAGWLFVAISSYTWVKTWRAHMMTLGDELKHKAKVQVSSRLFVRSRRCHVIDSPYKYDGQDQCEHDHHRRKPHRLFWRTLEWFSWYVRPTLVTCCLPVLFIVGWVYLGWAFGR
jgi:hypothetical protein